MKKSKILIMVMSAVLLIAVTVGVTVAYITDTKDLLNTFTMGRVDIILDETEVTPLGEPTRAGRTQTGNAYHLLPGLSYVKDPTVTVEGGSDDAYVRMLVIVNVADAMGEVFSNGNEFALADLVTGLSNAWTLEGTTVVNDVITFEYRYNSVVTKSAADTVLPALFTGLSVPGAVTGEDLESITGLEINIEAHAMQAVGFTDADAAWAAFN